MINFVQPGDIMNYANAGSAITAGSPVVIGDRVGVAMVDIANGDSGAVCFDGVFLLTKPTGGGTDYAQGTALFYDTGNSRVTSSGAGWKYVGICFKAPVTGDTTVQVKLQAHPKHVGYIAQIATADGSDAGTTQTLANANKAKINALLTALIAAGIMDAS